MSEVRSQDRTVLSTVLAEAPPTVATPLGRRSERAAASHPPRAIRRFIFRGRPGALGCMAVAVALLLGGAAMAQEDSTTEPAAETVRPDADDADESSPANDEPEPAAETVRPDTDESIAPPLPANESESARLYLTGEERRKAGRQYPLTSWLTAAALVELELQSRNYRLAEGHAEERLSDTSTSVQADLVATPWQNAKAEAVLEYDSAVGRIVADEAFLGVEVADWEIEAGRLYTPLGTYISHFASGPLLEFAESRVDGAILSYAPSKRLDLKLMGYRGKARPASDGSEKLDWAASIETRLGQGWLLGLSYQSDLADSREALLEDFDNRYRKRVGAAGGYAVWATADFDLTFEVMAALRSFDELEDDRNQPVAWNVEFAHFVQPRFDWALRWEGSRELVDAPEQRVGLALTWRPVQQASLTVEYLYGWFAGSLATNGEDEPYDRAYQIGAKLSVAF